MQGFGGEFDAQGGAAVLETAAWVGEAELVGDFGGEGDGFDYLDGVWGTEGAELGG